MKNIRVVAIIQARMGSSRLPGKVLRDIHGKPMLVWVVERTRKASCVSEVMVATTSDPSDDMIEQVCRQMNIPCFRGNIYDVLDRYYQAAREAQAEVVVRITADCPLIDAGLIDMVMQRFAEEKVDFAANRLPPPYQRTYPIGLDVEVVSFQALQRAWQEAKEKHEREHVLPYLYESPGRFKTLTVDHETDLGSYRWTVDTFEDLEFIQRLFTLLPDPENFTWLDVLKIVEENPQLSKINAGVSHKTFKDVDERSKEDGQDNG